MKIKFYLHSISFCILYLAVGFQAIGQVIQKEQLTQINLDFKAHKLAFSPFMYGLFFEDINHAADGGLYAEMIENRDFEYGKIPEGMSFPDDSTVANHAGWKMKYKKPSNLFGWEVDKKGEKAGTVEIEDQKPVNQANPHYLKVNIAKEGAVFGLLNDGFWGIASKANERYQISFYAKAGKGFKGLVNFSLIDSKGKTLAENNVNIANGEWIKYEFSLKTSEGDPKSKLLISSKSKGSFYLDLVSMFPAQTWKNHGMRNDLAKLLAEIKPSFLRFPGGCVVEGASLENRILWKNTIGDLISRPGRFNIWGYHATEGLGHHEYLQLCEDLKAEPMYVVNVGMSCQFRQSTNSGLEQTNVYLQDALDGIEYANGPITSKFGALRAKNGHPAPFNIKFVEIGNENNGPFYQSVYKIFQSAIKTKYPNIITIANEFVPINEADKLKNPGLGLEMIDEHYYESPGFFYQNTNKYDKYDRKTSPQIYIGEFAVTKGGQGQGNMRAALGEAAFMLGMERNADIVALASYAPTFVNVNDRAWNPNMIVYNNSQSFGTPSYYALKLFSENRPEHVIKTNVISPIDSSKNVEDDKILQGGIALGAWNTEVEYKDVKIEKDGKILFTDDFAKGLDKWRLKSDKWSVKDACLKNENTIQEAFIEPIETNWSQYNFSVKARKVKGAEGFLIRVVTNNNNFIVLNLGGWNNSVHVTQQSLDNDIQDLGERIPANIETGKWYDIRVEVGMNSIKFLLDGKLLKEEKYRKIYKPTVYATSGVKANGDLVLKIVNPTEKAQTCEINLDSFGAIQSVAEAFVLSSKDQSDENSFAAPFKIAPKSIQLQNLSSTFKYNCPSGSITIINLKKK